MHVLFSIKPEFCDAILSKEKRYEFRRRLFRSPERVESVLMYSTAPVQRIVGQFTVKSIRQGTPREVWNECKRYAGLSRKQFFEYFESAQTAFAIEIGEVRRFRPINPRAMGLRFRPPQSFCYVGEELLAFIQGHLSSSHDLPNG